jgi:hypothetical protein
MNIRIMTLLILSGVFYQAHGVDGGLAAEQIQTDFSTWGTVKHSVYSWFEHAQLDDENIKGGVPGLRYLMHFHGGKCVIAGVVIVGSYALYRNHKNKQKKQRERDEQETEKIDDGATQFPEKELKTAVGKTLAYIATQISALSQLIK